MDFINSLWNIGSNYVPEAQYSALTIKGFWDTTLVFQPHPSETIFECSYLICQTEHQGCSFYEPEGTIRTGFEDLIGKHFTAAAKAPLPVKIAVLDSIFAYRQKQIKPDLKLKTKGNPSKKAFWRAQVVSNEVDALLFNKQDNNPAKIVLIGYSGLILDQLLSRSDYVTPFDFKKKLVGLEIRPGVTIHHGEEVNKYLTEADIAVVTGMTLATNTLENILKNCVQNNTKVIVYAQTASNIAPWYLSFGATSAVCEKIPFYNFEGWSEIAVYRKTNWLERIKL